MLKILQDILVGKKGLMVTEVDQKTGIMTQTITTASASLSVGLSVSVFEVLSKFYIEKTVGKEAASYNVLKNRVDSLYHIINHKDFSKAEIEDKSFGLWNETNRTPSRILDRDIRIATIMYGEALKNLELAYFSLKTKTPFVQVIDKPFLPIEKIKKSKLKTLLVGFFIGSVGSFILLVTLRRLFS